MIRTVFLSDLDSPSGLSHSVELLHAQLGQVVPVVIPRRRADGQPWPVFTVSGLSDEDRASDRFC